jgi:methyl-accepting chemotaxis protein
MRIFQNSLIWALVIPVPIVAGIGAFAVWLILPQVVSDNARADASAAATETVSQFKTIRGYYTKNIIKKVLKDGNLKPSITHASEEKSVPLPATFIHDVSKLLEKRDTSVKLYSKFPFPNRKDRKLDDFQATAWEYLIANPDGKYVRQETIGGRERVRVAIADKMSAQGCVNCHNSHPDTPKDDWKLGDVRGILEVTTAIDGPLARGASLSNSVIIAVIVLSILLSAVTVLTSSRIINRLKAMIDVMGRLAQGDTEVEIPALDRADEIGEMAHAVQVFKENGIEQRRLEAETKEARIREEKDKEERLAEASRREQAEVEAEAERQSQVMEERRALMNKLADDFETSVGGVVQSVSASSIELKASAQSMSSTAEETNAQSSAVAAAAEQASANVQTVAAAAEELSASIGEITRQVSQSSEIASNAVVEAQHTNQQVQGLAMAAEKIGEVVGLISDIAEQTNLLALNATIEAARAGDAGKGFAVVASEVKNLASQTATATGEIEAQIGDIQAATQEAVAAIQSIGKTITEVNEIATAIATAVEEQSAATQEIARNVEQASAGTSEVTSNIAGVTQAAGETGRAADQMQEAAGELSMQSTTLKVEVDKFLDEIRAG